jgi:hypothetical protein
MASIASVTAALILDISKFKSQIQGAEKELLKMNRSMQNIGMNLSAALTLPIGAFAATATKTAAEFGFIQAKIAGLSGSSTIIEGLSNSARQLGRDTIFTAAEVSNLQLELVKLGLREREIKAVQDQVVRFAQALDIELAQAGSTVVELLNKMPNSFSEFSTKTEAAQYATDAFAYAVATAALDTEGLTSSLNYVGAEADAMGFSFENTVGMLAVLANAGYKGSRAGTQLRRILVEVAGASDDSAKSMREFNESGATFQEVLQEVGIRAAGMGVALQGQQGFIDRFAKGMENSEGYLQNVSDVIEDSLQYSLKRTQSAFEELQISFTTAVEPAIRLLLDALTFLINGFSAIPGPIKVVMVALAALAAVVGPLLVIIAKYNILMIQATVANARFAMSMRTMMAAMGWVGLIGLAVGVIASFAVSTDEATESFDDFKNSLEGLKVPGENISAIQAEVKRLTSEEEDLIRVNKELEKWLADTRRYGKGPNPGKSIFTREELKDNLKLLAVIRAQKAEAQAMLSLEKERKKQYEERIEIIKRDTERQQRAALTQGRSFNQLLARYREVEAAIAGLQRRAKGGGDVTKILGDISVRQEELGELKGMLEALGYSFDKNKKELTDWEKALKTANDSWNRAKAEFAVTGDEIAKLEAWAAGQRDLAIAAQLLGEEKSEAGIKALQDFIEFTKRANAAKEAKELADAMDAANSAFKETMSGLDFEKGLGGITDAEYTQQRADAFRTLADSMLQLGNIDLATQYYNQALALDALIKQQEESNELQTTQNQEFLSFVQNIGNAFGNIFRDLTSGSKTFAEVLKTNMIDALTAILAKLVAIAIMWGIIAILSGGTSVLSGAAQGIQRAGFGSFAMGQFGLGSFANKSAPVTVDGSISGHTIYLSNKRALNSYDRTYGG